MFAGAWQWTSLSEYVNAEKIADLAHALEYSTAAPFIVVAAYALGGLVVFPVTVLIVATALVFAPHWSVLYSLAGSAASAALLYAVGRWLGKDVLRYAKGDRTQRLLQQLSQPGILAVALVRNIPVAPFSFVNLMAGALRVTFRDFLLGTILGMSPSIIAASILMNQFRTILTDPDWVTAVVAVVFLAVFITASALFKKRLLRRE
mgnify:FL=1